MSLIIRADMGLFLFSMWILRMATALILAGVLRTFQSTVRTESLCQTNCGFLLCFCACLGRSQLRLLSHLGVQNIMGLLVRTTEKTNLAAKGAVSPNHGYRMGDFLSHSPWLLEIWFFCWFWPNNNPICSDPVKPSTTVLNLPKQSLPKGNPKRAPG